MIFIYIYISSLPVFNPSGFIRTYTIWTCPSQYLVIPFLSQESVSLEADDWKCNREIISWRLRHRRGQELQSPADSRVVPWGAVWEVVVLANSITNCRALSPNVSSSSLLWHCGPLSILAGLRASKMNPSILWHIAVMMYLFIVS